MKRNECLFLGYALLATAAIIFIYGEVRVEPKSAPAATAAESIVETADTSTNVAQEAESAQQPADADGVIVESGVTFNVVPASQNMPKVVTEAEVLAIHESQRSASQKTQ